MRQFFYPGKKDNLPLMYGKWTNTDLNCYNLRQSKSGGYLAMKQKKDLQHLLSPESIAIIGATDRKDEMSSMPVKLLL